jgi:TolB-like protein/Tfp pilus assembly protein PilF/tRNA A-37 threonylcarbamoyl transferase component Bud32
VLGQQFGHYRILEKIGAGGMGEVYRAHDEQLDRDVALKVLPAQALTDEVARARLLREARSAAALNHPHICTVHEVGEAGGQAYIAMELVEGQPLSELVPEQGLPVETVLRFGSQIADALAHAHDHRIVHRDLKSVNVMITPEGRSKVLDFGLAKRLSGEELAEAATKSLASLTQAGLLIGTVAYMAPEQLRGQPADARSDVWSLGVVLYEMAVGRRPFQGDTSFELSSAILNQVPPPLPPAVPTELRAVIERCLAKEPGQRYQRGSEVREALEAIQSGVALPAWPVWRYALSRRRWLVLTAGVPMLAAILVALNVGGLRERLGGGAPRIHSLAVLPLENLSGDKEQEYFADGMTEELITNLAKISALKIISRTSVMLYKGAKKPLPQIAKELNVDALIEGSVLREGGQVRITAELIQASTDQHLWAESYQRDLRGVLALQGEIASAIAEKVRAAVTPTERARLASARPVNPEAYEAYLKGKFYLNKMTPEGYEKGLAYVQQAIDKDPTNPLPYAQLALAYAVIGHERFPDFSARAKVAARKAEELGGEPPAEMYSALAMTKLYWDWDYAGAEKDLRRAMELNPSLGEAHRDYSWYLFLIRRRDEALAEMRRAEEFEPLNPLFAADRGWQYWWAGQNDKAMEEARKSLELDPNFNEGLYVLGFLYAEKGMYAEAIAAHQKAGAVDPDWRWGLARTYAQAGRKDEARRTLAKFLGEKAKPTGAWAGWFLAEIYAALGEKDEALRWLEACYKERHSFLPWLEDNPAYAPLRSDPRFQDLVRRMNLPP